MAAIRVIKVIARAHRAPIVEYLHQTPVLDERTLSMGRYAKPNPPRETPNRIATMYQTDPISSVLLGDSEVGQ